MKMKFKAVCLVIVSIFASLSMVQGATVFLDDFNDGTENSWWSYQNPGSASTEAGGVLNFSRGAISTSYYFARHQKGLGTVTDMAYVEFEISNLSVVSNTTAVVNPWFRIVANNQQIYKGTDTSVHLDITTNGLYQVFLNNSSETNVPYSDGNGISGTLSNQSYSVYIDGVLIVDEKGVFGANVTAGATQDGLGWGEWGNNDASVSFDIDNFELRDVIDYVQAVPSGLTAGGSDGRVDLDWADVLDPDFSHYNIYRSTTSGTNYVSLSTNEVVSAYTDTAVTNDTTYYYVVTAVYASSGETAYSAEASATPQAFPDPIAHWEFDDNGGTTATDSSGNGYDGTVVGATWVDGTGVSALDFNAAGSNTVDVPVAPFNTLDNEISFALWVVGDSAVMPVDNSVLRAEDSSGNRILNIHLPWGSGKVYWDVSENGVAYDRIEKQASGDEIKGVWNHWVFTKDAVDGTMAIYLNGAPWYSESGKTDTIGTCTVARLGSGIEKFYYDGIIDDVRVYNKSLNPTQVADLYASLPTPPAPPVDPRILEDTFGNGNRRNPEYWSGGSVVNYWTAKGTESGGGITFVNATGSQDNYYGKDSSELDFFSRPIKLELRELDIGGTFTDPSKMVCRMQILATGTVGWNEADGIYLVVDGAGNVRAEYEINSTVKSWGTTNFFSDTSTFGTNEVTGFDLTLDGTSGTEVSWSLTAYGSNDVSVSDSGTLAMTPSDWNGGDGTTRVGFWLQPSNDSSGNTQTITMGEFNISQVVAPPAPEGFAAFVSDYGLSSVATNDFDGDGLNDYAEYVLGGNPTNGWVDATIPWIDVPAGDYVYSLMGDDSVVAYISTCNNLALNNWTSIETNQVTATDGVLGAYTNGVDTSGPQLFIKMELKTP